jgi:hypothetical protein
MPGYSTWKFVATFGDLVAISDVVVAIVDDVVATIDGLEIRMLFAGSGGPAFAARLPLPTPTVKRVSRSTPLLIWRAS